MSALGVLAVALALWWNLSLAACVFLLVFKKWKAGAVAGGMFFIGIISWSLLMSTKDTGATDALVQKATAKIKECSALGEKPIIRSEKTLVWDLDAGDAVQTTWIQWMDPRPPDSPVTVFLVSEERRIVGRYSISGQPAYRESVNIYVVQFRNSQDDGTALGAHELLSSGNPRQERPVTNNPEYGPYSRTTTLPGQQQESAEPPSEEGLRAEKVKKVEDWVNRLPAQ